MHDQAGGRGSEYALHESAFRVSGDDNLIGLFAHRGLIQQVGDITMLDDPASLETFSLECFDSGIHQPRRGRFDFFFATLVANGVFFSGLKRIR